MRRIILIILDGWGIGRKDASNPIHIVNPKSFRFLEENYPATSLQASGISVGLPWGETGNSEVGHLTIGAGKTIYQHYPRITLAIEDGTFFNNPALKDAFAHARQNNSAVNIIGLLTKANTHASIKHLQSLIDMAKKENIDRVNLHLFGDGKDSPPKTFDKFLLEIPQEKIATLIGRYYAMDRRQEWELTQRAYECLTGDVAENKNGLQESTLNTYEKFGSEEFLPPICLNKEKTIKDNDSLIFFDFREDSMRQIAESFINPSFDKFQTKNFKNLYIATMTNYKDDFKVPVAFPAEKVENPLGKVISDLGKTQIRLAETYKYAHITYFFNGLREPPFKNEFRVLIPSLSVPDITQYPEMMAGPITDRLIQAIESQSFDFILVNYANPDTIAHTGNMNASIEAVKVIDKQIERLLEIKTDPNTIFIITSDHGNVEELVNPLTGEAETQHDPNPVPFYLIGEEFKGRQFLIVDNTLSEGGGVLSDVAPTILELMNIPKPPEMNGRSLLGDLI